MGTTWTVQSESNESRDWTIDNLSSLDTKDERNAWSLSPVSPDATGRSRVLGWGNWAVEDFHFLPEEVDILPDEIQADREQWTLQAEAD